MIPLDLSLILLACFAFAIASIVHGYSGFGFGIICMAIFALSPHDLEGMAAVTTIVILVVFSVLFFQSRRESPVHWRHVVVINVGAFVSMPLGYWLLVAFKDLSAFRIVAGAVIVYYAINGIRSPHARKPVSALAGVALGFVGGILGGAIVAAGPPVIYYLYSQSEDPRDMKRTLQVVFLVMTVWRAFLVFFGEGGYSTSLFLLVLWVLPVSAGAIMLGHRMSRGASVHGFRRKVYILLALSGALVAARGFFITP